VSTFDHAHPGQPISGIPAAAYNAALDAARAYQQSGTLVGRKAALQAAPSEIWVRNNSAAAVHAFDVLALGLPIIVPADNESEFEQQVMFEGGTPSVPADLGEWAVCLEPIPAGKIGRARASGLCQVRLYVPDGQEEYEFADVADGATGYLLLQREGPAQVLWRESGFSSDVEDLKWALVRIGRAPLADRVFAVLVTEEGGAAGGPSTDCAFTYTVNTLQGEQLTTGLMPKRPRFSTTEYNQPTANSPGLAYLDANGDLQLYEAAQETPKTDTVAVVTSIDYDTTAHAFRLKKTPVRVLEKAAEDASWTPWLTLADECDIT